MEIDKVESNSSINKLNRESETITGSNKTVRHRSFFIIRHGSVIRNTGRGRELVDHSKKQLHSRVVYKVDEDNLFYEADRTGSCTIYNWEPFTKGRLAISGSIL